MFSQTYNPVDAYAFPCWAYSGKKCWGSVHLHEHNFPAPIFGCFLRNANSGQYWHNNKTWPRSIQPQMSIPNWYDDCVKYQHLFVHKFVTSDFVSDHKHQIRKCSARAEGVLNSGRVYSGGFIEAINNRRKIHTDNPPKNVLKSSKKRKAEEILKISKFYR